MGFNFIIFMIVIMSFTITLIVSYIGIYMKEKKFHKKCEKILLNIQNLNISTLYFIMNINGWDTNEIEEYINKLIESEEEDAEVRIIKENGSV